MAIDVLWRPLTDGDASSLQPVLSGSSEVLRIWLQEHADIDEVIAQPVVWMDVPLYTEKK